MTDLEYIKEEITKKKAQKIERETLYRKYSILGLKDAKKYLTQF